MSVSAIEKEYIGKMVKAVDYLKQELRGVRTGRASPALVEHVKIEISSYGRTMELREVASIGVPDPGTLLIKPYDPSTLKDIERGLQSANLGLTPQGDGKSVRLPIPPLSGERRQQLIQQVKKLGEAQKIVVRNARRDANKAIDAAEKEKTVSEDESKESKDRIQKQTKKFEDQIDEVVKAKTAEIEQT